MMVGLFIFTIINGMIGIRGPVANLKNLVLLILLFTRIKFITMVEQQ